VDPTAACQDITVQLDQSGTFSIVASDVDAGSADNCAVSSIVVSPSTFDCSNLGTETVTLTVADDFGNQSTCTADVTVLDTIPPTSICQDITVQLDGSGNASIVPSQIDNGSNDVCGIASITLDVTSFNCSNAGANVVTLTVEDNSGNTSQCTATVTVEETVPPTASCQDATVYLDELGQASISAADVDAGSTDNCAITSISVSPSDFLCAQLGIQPVTLTVEDGSGNTDNCSASITVLDTISPQIIDCPSDILVPSNSSTCASPVTWSEPTATDNCSANLASNFTSGTTFPIGVTQVFYTATDQSGNTAQCFFNVEVNADLLNINLTAITYTCGTNVSCNGADDGQATASVTGGCEPYSFLWSDGQSTSTAVDLASGDQIVTVTDANGNQLSDTIFITEPAAISTNFISSPRYPGEVNVSCFGAFDGVIYSEAEGGADCQSYQYQWTGPNGYTSTDQNPANVEAGQFSVTITDVNGCSHSDSITLIEPDPIEAETFPNSYNGFGVSCFGGSDGAINLEVTGGIPGYDYQWSNGDSIQDINALTAGQYDVLVTDTNGCQTTATVTLNEPTPVVASFTDTLLISCNGLNTGQVTVQGSGGLPGYTYLWSNGDTDQLLSGVGAGTYQAIVTDINGCQDSLEIVLTEPPAVTVDVIQITPTTCFGGNDGSATVAAAGGNGPYSYLWQPSLSNSATASGLSAGNHIYTVTDANGCDISDTLLVGQPDQMVIVTSNDTTVCPGSFVDLTATVTGGGGTYLINWESGQGFGESYSAYYQQTTNVSVTAQDQNGCTAAPNSVIVTTLQPVQADFDYQVINPCSAPFQVDFTNETTNGFSYQWYFQNGDSSTQFLASTQFDSAGVYSVNLIATSDEGCVDTLNSFITIDDLPVAAFNIPTNAACYPFMVSHQNQSTGANSFFWDFGDGETSDEGSPFHFYDEAGAYTVTLIATNQNGCSDTLMVDSAVVAYPSPVASFNPVSTGSESGNEFFMDNTSQGAVEYFWLFDGTDFSELFEPTHAFAEHGGYDIILTAYNQYGCDDTALVSVTVELTSGLFVPNAMVVGENGLGGRFQPIGTGLATYHVWVFDLWGNQLWESTSLTNGSPAEYWDGRYKGAMVPQGAYTWKIEAVFKDGEVWDGMPQASGKPKNIGSVTVIY
ncbi:MAG: HYR domain-containing protein, partial [Flavobacteriales bacterium]|nr:HYR domain-containing protein [Flavobacteriales bacterium]